MNLQRLFLTVAALAAFALFVTLGRWQLDRAAAREDAQVRQDAALQQSERGLAATIGEASPQLPARVRAHRGAYAPAPPVLLDNQLRNGRNGVSVYRVFEPGDGLAPVLVDLGWIAWPADRHLPPLPTPAADQRPHGLLVPWPGQALALGRPPGPPADGSPWLLPRLSRAELGEALGVELFDGVLRLAGDADHGFDRAHDPLATALPPSRHRGYALQWFSLAAAVVVVYGVLAWKTRKR